MDKQNNHNVPSEQQEKTEKKKSSLRETVEYAESLAVVFVVMLLIFTFIARPATVDGESMMPTLQNGERLVISNLFYEPTAGDIVVLCGEADREEGKNLIKRIIATEGQTIDIDFEAGEVYVDGQKLDEPYILEPTYLDEGTEFPLTVPKGEIFAPDRPGARAPPAPG